MIELQMPALSPTMEKGTLANWLVQEGDLVKPGDRLAEIETDKATMEFEATEKGRIAKIVVPAGSEDVSVGTIIALMSEDGEQPQIELPQAKIEPVPAVEVAKAPEAVEIPTPRQPPAAIGVPKAGIGELTDNINATPLANRLARIEGIPLSKISGSGARGKITRADLNVASLVRPAPLGTVARAQPSVALSPMQPAVSPPPEGVPVETIALSSMRKTIARRLTESKTQVPHFYLTVRCNLDPLLALRGELNAALAQSGIKLSVNDMLIKAMALALTRVPDANVQFGGDVLHRFQRVDISMAVAIDGGLVTPVIRDVGALSLSGIAKATQELASKARAGKLVPEDYQGGTASLSNLGMFGIDGMVPVINPPQALILGTAAGIRQPWEVDGELRLATVMAATGSFDHRAIDGATAAQFIAAFKSLVEQPLTIMT